MLDEVMRRLEEASIEAFSTTERAGVELYSGGALSVSVWIRSAQDLAQASGILRAVQAEETRAKCPNCQYDLRGQAGRSTCPECGHDLTAPAPDVECPKCGEAVPGGFELCWNCGVSQPDRSHLDA